MTPALAAAAGRKAASPLRLAFAYVPNGVTMEQWTPAAEGAAFELTRILKPLAPVKDRMLVLSGLEHENGNALGDGPGDHARAGAVFLTGVHCRKTAGADIKNGVSVDQIAARQIGSQTRLGSIELGCEDTRVVGNCDSGYSCAYTNSLSWRSETTPQPPETNPRAVFERLFGVDAGLDPATRAQRLRTRRSILDLVGERSAALRNDLGRQRSPQAGRVLHRRPRDRAAHRPGRVAQQRVAAGHGEAERHPRDVRRARLADVRPAGARVPGRHHPHRDDDDRPRGQHPDLPRDRRRRPAPSVDPPPQQPGVDREGDPDQRVPHGAVRQVHPEAGGDARRATARCSTTR